MFMLAPLCSAADPVMWPSKGAFPAYPSEEDTRQISVAATATYTDDSNLFRVSDQAPPPVAGTDERGDRYLRGSLALNADLDISRQKILIDANADHYSFDQFSQLDDWLYYGAFNWLWVVGSHLDGKIGYTQSLRYPDFSELQYASDDLVTTQYGHLSLDWQALKWMAVRTLVESSEYDHKDFTRSYLNNRVLAGTLGVFYVGPSHSAIGAQYKVSDGTYPNRETIGPVTVDNQYRETESSVVMSTPFESKMSADLRAGYTQRRHEDVIQRDFDGVTGRLQLRYSPTPKVLIDFAAYREVQPVEDLTASFAVVNGASIGPAWAPTPKWVLQASYVYNERSLDGNPGFVLTDTPPREDRIRAARVAIGYQPNRHVQATLSFEQGSRTSNVVDADYDYNLANLQLSVIL
jgi:exopolysaccharide biosynthesis operon protein EpsL